MRNKLTLMIGSTTLVLASTILTVAVQSTQHRSRDDPRQAYLSATATMQQMFKKQFAECLNRIKAAPH
jgi:hypothetical protein